MQEAKEILDGIGDYNNLSEAIKTNASLSEKKDFSLYIETPAYTKQLAKSEQVLSKYYGKIADLKAKAKPIHDEIELNTDEINFRSGKSIARSKQGLFSGIKSLGADTLKSTKPGMFDDAEAHNNRASKYNAVLDLVRRLEDKRERLTDKYSAIMERLEEAEEEAKEKLEELNEASLSALDDDVVLFFDRIIGTLEKSNGKYDNLKYALGLLEISLLSLNFFNIAYDLVDSSDLRKDIKAKFSDIQGWVEKIITSESLVPYFSKIYGEATSLESECGNLSKSIKESIHKIDQNEVKKHVEALSSLYGEEFISEFDFQSGFDGGSTFQKVKSPDELNIIIESCKSSISAIEINKEKSNKRIIVAESISNSSKATHSVVSNLLGEMKHKKEAIAPHVDSFALLKCYLKNEVFDDLFQKIPEGIKHAIASILKAAGGDDAFVIVSRLENIKSASEKEIANAKLLQLNTIIKRNEEHQSNLDGLLSKCKNTLPEIEEEPKKQVKRFLQSLKSSTLLASIPLVGVIFGFAVKSQVEDYKNCFMSDSEVYSDLAKDSIAKLKSSITVGLVSNILTAIASSVGVFYTSGKIGISAGTGILMLLLYGLTYLSLKKSINSIEQNTPSLKITTVSETN